ncbi:fibronectin type III domain-containing protein [Chloroflexi bacterium TSY]|nr:fibronectin type III domain-containing protein [Chloroflexi bacterium TSY]
MTELRLSANQFDGPIPTEIGRLLKLTHLLLSFNNFDGPIPSELGALQQLKFLGLQNNRLSGQIPSEFRNLTMLTDLLFNDNPSLSGPLPDDLLNIPPETLTFHYHNTKVCAPPKNDIQVWLSKIGSGKLMTSGRTCDDPFDCNTVTEIPVAECEAVVTLYNSTNGLDWIDNTGWLQTDTPCNWFGITCSNNQIATLILNKNSLSGSIPAELEKLSGLATLELNENSLSGSIPTTLGNLGSLEYLSLSRNQLSGTIPKELGALKNLRAIWINESNLEGEIPKDLGNLAQLEILALGNSQLSGKIPEDLKNLTNLKFFNLGANRLRGEIPTWLGNFEQLKQISLFQNELTGTIPSELGALPNLTELILHFNDLSGIIPPALGGLTNLKDLRLNANRLHGEVPLSFKNFVALDYCDLRYNLLHQTLDEELRVILTNKCEGWYSTQTVRPTNVQVSAVTTDSVTLMWTPIDYTANGGSYQILFSTSQGGPYQQLDETVDKTIDTYTVTDLTPDTTYYFVIRTHTLPVPTKTRLDLQSDWTPEVSATTHFVFSCTNVTEISQAECEALTALYGSTDGPNWSNNTGWLQTNAPCSWLGITCTGNTITRLALPTNQLNGSVPPELDKLSGLNELHLHGNRLSGRIPVRLGNLANLTLVNLQANHLRLNQKNNYTRTREWRGGIRTNHFSKPGKRWKRCAKRSISF